jgi:hypothetical protein
VVVAAPARTRELYKSLVSSKSNFLALLTTKRVVSA